jgi:HAD superfamily hydrolase (TIGR01509 family)
MNIIIPIGGKGERFLNNGYTQPKPLINIFEKPMIFYVLDNLLLSKNDNIYIIYNNKNINNNNNFINIVNNKYPYIKFIKLEYQTKGAAETIYIGLQEIIKNTHLQKTLILDCDTFYTQDVLSMYRNIEHNAVFYVNNLDINPIFSYILFNSNSDNNDYKFINKIVEKKKISNNANTGIYCFSDINILYQYSKNVVENNITFNNECYTSCIIEQMIKDNHKFVGIELNPLYVFNLGTPKQLEEYLNNTFIFLFDLDGTLILTEDIYFYIWKEIAIDFNYELTYKTFQTYISGNNDNSVILKLWPNMSNNIKEISNKKNLLFKKYIDNIILIEGVYDTLSLIKKHGHQMAIVTNCNRESAEDVLNKFNINKYFNFIIIGNECNNPKPYPDPYINAMKKFNINNNKVIIFEDSKSGLLSANSSNAKCIIGIETLYTSEELLNTYCAFTMPNFLNFDLNKIIKYCKETNLIKELEDNIVNSLSNLNIKKIHKNNNMMKGGFISDVFEINIETETEVISCVAKIENENENFLTKMSNDLDLYEREYYFYEYISYSVPIKIPKFYGLIKNSNHKNIGILLENINNNNYKLNLNLNNEPINTSLKVIDTLTLLHSHFWEKNTLNFKLLKKNNNDLFNPYWNNFISSRWHIFKLKWSHILSEEQILKGEYIVKNFLRIQQELSNKNLTLCHGDVKSPNIFYKILENNNYEPYFIDWQYIVLGKGVQDLVFFMIESFDISKMKIYKNMFKEYYYIKLIENGVVDYLKTDFETDFENASYYFPFFVAMWFGTISEDELIDKDFPVNFIKKLFNFYII